MSVDVFAVHDAIAKRGLPPQSLYKGDCRGCGECCSRILPMSQYDIERLRSYVRKRGIEQIPERAEIDMLCPYLTDDGECAVYHARPDICRGFRCDLCKSGELAQIVKYLTHPPYEKVDIREVMEDGPKTV